MVSFFNKPFRKKDDNDRKGLDYLCEDLGGGDPLSPEKTNF